MLPVYYSDAARQAVELGERHHLTFRVVGAGVVDEPYYESEMVYEPCDLNNYSMIPEEALRRVEILKRAGIPIKDYIIRHEAPRLLTAPVKPKNPIELPKVDTGKLRAVGLTVLSAAGVIVMGVAQVVGMALLLALDPGLIVVLDDGRDTQVEVATWLE
jgi:hypothetical protein